MKLFQLVAWGNSQVCGQIYSVMSNRVFRTEAAARAHMPKFLEKCTTRADDTLDAIDPKTVECRIVELELEEKK